MTQKNAQNHGSKSPNQKPVMIYVLWTVQGLLALLFLFAGSMKFIMPIEMMTKQTHGPRATARSCDRYRADGCRGHPR